MDEISLSTNEFKALSSKTRTNILKMLDERNYTLSELSAKTGMAPPTVKQHTTILADAGFIELKDEGRKWKYYSLTDKGQKVIESKKKQTGILIVLSSTIIVCLLALTIMQFTGISSAPMMADTPTLGYRDTGQQSEITSINKEGTETVVRKCIGIIEKDNEKCAEIPEKEECEEKDFEQDQLKDCKWDEQYFVN